MEEDIKVLEKELANIRNLIEYYTFESLDYDKKFRMEKFEKAIENLIKGYKELEKEYRHLREYINFAPNLDEMSAVKYIEMIKPSYLEGREEEKHRAQQFIEENCIPKSKVREKKEELKEILKDNLHITYNRYGKPEQLLQYGIDILEEFLNEGDK